MKNKPCTILSWNVSGLRAILKKGFHEFLSTYKPDVLCLQEIKLSQEHVDGLGIDYPYATYHCAERKGYSGTAILSRCEPLKVVCDGLGKAFAGEGRVLAYEFENLVVVNVYTPNAQAGLKRLAYRDQEWDPAFRKYIKKLAKQKPTLVCGDFNVAHEEIDLAHPKANRQSPGFTDEERAQFTKHISAGLVDTFRRFHPGEPSHYSWWSYRTHARDRNIGWRLDYCLASESLMPKVKRAYILKDVLGSDHAPVGVDLG